MMILRFIIIKIEDRHKGSGVRSLQVVPLSSHGNGDKNFKKVNHNIT